VSKLVKKLYAPWDLNENLAKKFTHNNKIKKQLLKKNIQPQPLVRLALAKAALQATGEYELPLRAFESKPSADQTFTIVCQFITTEYSKHFRSDCTKAKSMGFGIANQAVEKTLTAEEQREAEMALALERLSKTYKPQATKRWKHLWISPMTCLRNLLPQTKGPTTLLGAVLAMAMATNALASGVSTASASIQANQTTNAGTWKGTPPIALKGMLFALPKRMMNEGARGKRKLRHGNQERLTYLK